MLAPTACDYCVPQCRMSHVASESPYLPAHELQGRDQAWLVLELMFGNMLLGRTFTQPDPLCPHTLGFLVFRAHDLELLPTIFHVVL